MTLKHTLLLMLAPEQLAYFNFRRVWSFVIHFFFKPSHLVVLFVL